MPAIPRFDNDVNLRPSGAAQQSPGAMAAVGRALSQVGDEQTDIMTSFLQRRTEAKRGADAAHEAAKASGDLDNIQQQWSLIPDRDQAQTGFDTDAKKMRERVLAGINDPLVRSHVSQSVDREIANRREATAHAAFRLESSARRGQLDKDLDKLANSAAAASDDDLRAKLTTDGIASIRGAIAGGWLDPETGEKAVIGFQSKVQEVQARKLMNEAIDAEDGTAADDVAQRLSDPKDFPGLLPERREILRTRLESLAYRLDQRAAAKQAHADATAARNLNRSQAVNEAKLLGAINTGKPLSASDIEHLAETQQISAGGVQALTAAIARNENGIDKAEPTLRLWHAINTKQATSDMIFDGLKNGDISRNTSVAMMRALDAKTSKQNDQVVRQAFGQLRTALHGDAIQQGIIPNKSPEASAWAQAQGEWTQRVTIGGENAIAVKEDMLKRYAHDTASPTWLAQPKMGLVQSAQDLAAVAARTGAARKAGKISEDDYRAQLRLLSDYKKFYPITAKKPQQPGAKP